MHHNFSGGELMNSEICFKTAVCIEYENLLTACQESLVAWKSRRDEISRLRSNRKAVADELLRLQADYAKAYSHLKKHQDDCELCQFVSKLSGRNRSSISDAVLR